MNAAQYSRRPWVVGTFLGQQLHTDALLRVRHVEVVHGGLLHGCTLAMSRNTPAFCTIRQLSANTRFRQKTAFKHSVVLSKAKVGLKSRARLYLEESFHPREPNTS